MRKEYLTLGYQNTRGEGVFYLFHGSKVYFKVYFIGGFLWFLRHRHLLTSLTYPQISINRTDILHFFRRISLTCYEKFKKLIFKPKISFLNTR